MVYYLNKNAKNYMLFFPLCILKNNNIKKNSICLNNKNDYYYSEKYHLSSNCNTIWNSYITYYGDNEINTVTKKEYKSWI
jgi:hypothetical protein